MRKGFLTVAMALLIAAVGPGLAGAKPKKHKPKPRPVSLSVQSSRPDMVSGGNALIAVDVPKPDPIGKVRVRRNGVDVTAAFAPDAQNPRRLLGVVAGMQNGSNRISALVKGKGQRGPAELSLFNSPMNGPIISGPHQEPFICRTSNNGLGAPTDADCSAPMAVQFQYRTTGGTFKPLPDPGSRPADMAQTTTRTGQAVDYVVRIESGVINRSIYRWAVLSAGGQTGTGWNGRLIFSFGGGCSAGHQQGDIGLGSVLDNRQLSEGYAVASSSLNVFQTACNDVLSAETASMVKERVIEALGRAPTWTIGEGGSGGSVQAQMTGQNYPGLLDGLLPQQSFPDNSQPTYPDCRLLTDYFATSPGSSLSDAQQEAITGLSNTGSCNSMSAGADVVNASEGCQESIVPPSIIFDPVTNPGGIRCTLWDSMINVYGTDPATGKARRTFDNTGVQYGLGALQHGDLTLDEFLDLNEDVGGFNDDGTPVAQRSVADPEGLDILYRTGRMDQAAGGIPSLPIIDARDYADNQANVHQEINGYIMRARLQRTNGTYANQVMFRAGGGANVQPMQDAALDLMGQWLDAIKADSSSRSLPQKVIADKPPAAIDACWIGGNRIDEPAAIGGAGPCQTAYPPHSLPRMVAGMPIDSFVEKCRLVPVDPADYGSPSPTQITRLHQVFPGGVCDYGAPGVGEQPLAGTWQSFGPPQTITARKRRLGLRAKRTRSGLRLTARLRPCPEVTWQRVTFERRRGHAYRKIKSPIVDGKKCTVSIRVGSGGAFRAVAKPITGYAQARSKRR
jgi:Tannase-like family of unknown function (DUF6351)